MPKSLLLVLPILALVAPTASAGPARSPSTVVSGRSTSQSAHQAWFHKAIGNILEGRTAGRAR